MCDPFISQIQLFGCTYAPSNWISCSGQLLRIADLPALYALIGSYYGGDGRVSMGVPDLRGRIAAGQGAGIGLTNRFIGEIGGFESIPLNLENMPSHTHSATSQISGASGKLSGSPNVNTSVKCNNTDNPSGTEPSGKVWGKLTAREKIYADNIGPNDEMHAGSVEVNVDLSPVDVDISIGSSTVTVYPTGGQTPHYNMQPYLVCNYSMAVEGYFPPRN